MKKVLVIDTSVLCVWLKVPGKETCGPSIPASISQRDHS